VLYPHYSIPPTIFIQAVSFLYTTNRAAEKMSALELALSLQVSDDKIVDHFIEEHMQDCYTHLAGLSQLADQRAAFVAKSSPEFVFLGDNQISPLIDNPNPASHSIFWYCANG